MLTFGLALEVEHKSKLAALQSLESLIHSWWDEGDGKETALSTREWQSETGTVREYRAEKVNAEESGLWTTEIRTYSSQPDAPKAALTIAMGMQSGASWIRPVPYRFKSPTLLPMLSRDFTADLAGEACSAAPRIVDTRAKLDSLLSDLQDDKRRVPIVVVSETQDEELILPDLDTQLALRLFGVARVVRMNSVQALQMVGRVGKEMSCFNGGVRLYWPCWTTHASPFQHRLYTRKEILQGTEGDVVLAWKRLLGKLMMQVGRATVVNYECPAFITRVIQEAEDAKSSAQDNRDETVKELRSQVAQKDAAISLLEKRIAQLESQGPAADATTHEESQWDYTTDEALAAARLNFKPLVHLPSNLTIDGTMSGGTVYYFLKSLHAVCSLMREGKLDSGIAQALRAMLATNGISSGYLKVGPTGVYANMPGQPSKECRFRYHLKSGSRNDTQSVYWADYGGAQDRVMAVSIIGLHA